MVISEFQVLKSDFFLVSNALTVYTHCWSACEYSVLFWFLVFTQCSWCQKYRHIASHWHTTQSCINQQFIRELINNSKLTIFETVFGEMSGEDCRPLSTIRCEWWNGATVFAIPCSVFDPLPAVICFGKPWRATDDAAEDTDDFLHFFFLIKNTV